MEGRDLVIIKVRRDVGLCCEGFFHDLDRILGDAADRQPLRIRGKVFADGRHNPWFFTEKLQVISDIAGTPTVFTAKFRDQEGHIQDVNLLWEDVVLEFVGKHHDGVVGHGATDEGRHRENSSGLEWGQ